MSLWDYTTMAVPVIAGSFALMFLVIETANLCLFIVDRLRPRGRDRD